MPGPVGRWPVLAFMRFHVALRPEHTSRLLCLPRTLAAVERVGSRSREHIPGLPRASRDCSWSISASGPPLTAGGPRLVCECLELPLDAACRRGVGYGAGKGVPA